MASRVLPTPAGPIKVTSRRSTSGPASRASSACRPMNEESGRATERVTLARAASSDGATSSGASSGRLPPGWERPG